MFFFFQAKNNIILDEDIRTVALLVRNQISYLTREKARYQKKLAQNLQEQNNQNKPPLQQPASQTQNIGMQSQSIQGQQMGIPQPFIVSTQQPLDLNSQQMLHQERYQQVYQTQMHMSQQVTGTDYQAPQLCVQVSQLQDVSQMHPHAQNMQPVVSHMHGQNAPAGLTQMQSQQMPQNQVNQCFQYQQNLCVQSQNQATQVSPPLYTTSVQHALTEDTTIMSPEHYQSQQQESAQILQPMTGAHPHPTAGSEAYQVTIQQQYLQNLASGATVPSQQIPNIVPFCQQIYSQDMQNVVHSQSQSSVPTQTRSPKKEVMLQQTPQLPNVSMQTATQMYSQQSVSHPQSPQTVLSPLSENPPSNFVVLSENVETPPLAAPDLSQMKVLSSQQFQQIVSPAVVQQSHSQVFTPQQIQCSAMATQQTYFTPIDHAKLSQESFKHASCNQLKQESLSRQPSMDSDKETVVQPMYTHNMSTSMTSESIHPGIV